LIGKYYVDIWPEIESMRKIWIDTDAGTDDAMALIMALKCAELDVVGISTVGGNVPLDNVLQNVLYICELCDQEVDVHRGAAQPLERVLGTADFIHGKDGLGDVGLPLEGRTPTSDQAIEQMIEAIRSNPNQVSIVNLGPLTNLALALRRAPDLIELIDHCYIMGGLIDLPGNVTDLAEFNIWADPEAAQEVLSSELNMTTIGWDTTVNSGWLSVEEWHDLLKLETKLATFAHDIQGVRMQWQKDNDHDLRLTWADPCAMAVVIDPSIIVQSTRVDMTVVGGDDDDLKRGFIEISNTQRIHHINLIDRTRFRKMINNYLSN